MKKQTPGGGARRGGRAPRPTHVNCPRKGYAIVLDSLGFLARLADHSVIDVQE